MFTSACGTGCGEARALLQGALAEGCVVCQPPGTPFEVPRAVCCLEDKFEKSKQHVQTVNCCYFIFLCSNSLNVKKGFQGTRHFALSPVPVTNHCDKLCLLKSNFCNKFLNILQRSIFNASSLLMDKGRQEGEVLWHRLADCPLCRLSLGAACSRVLSHRPAWTVLALLSPWF